MESVLRPTDLKCEYAVNPQGIDASQPRFSWTFEPMPTMRGLAQSAYQLQVATSSEALTADEVDLWDSGRVDNNQSINIVYGGKTLSSRQRCYWRVKVWSEDSSSPVVSDVAWFEMGLLSERDWTAKWIGANLPETHPYQTFAGCSWMWIAEGASEQIVWFRKTLNLHLESSGKVAKALLLLTAEDKYTLFVNGTEVARGLYWPNAHHVPIHSYMVDGENCIAIHLSGNRANAGIIGRLRIFFEEAGKFEDIDIDESWQVVKGPELDKGPDVSMPSWTNDEGYWDGTPVAVADYGMGPWGERVRFTPPTQACPVLRTEFKTSGDITKATIYATSAGIYELRLNGKPVGDDHFNPGWTNYHKRIQYQTFDVTNSLTQGENTLAASLGDGWYAGNLSIYGRQLYGSYPLGLLAQLEIEYTDGTKQLVATTDDGSWCATSGPVLYSDMHNGERYDARRQEELSGWDMPGFVDSAWTSVQVVKTPTGRLVAQQGPTVKEVGIVNPISVSQPKPGVFIFDMGQNMVGNISLRVQGPRGTLVRLRFGEMTNPDGTLYTTNLRDAQQTDEYTLAGISGVEEWQPKFTFHGFRYVEVTGYPGEPELNAITGHVLQSATPVTGEFKCSHPLVNQLASNIMWGQRGNFVSVPTDCPQRDERMGWTGDAQAFVGTACYQMDSATFYSKWLRDVADEQRSDGAVTDVAPFVPVVGAGTPAWGDASVIVPWTIWQRYGDTEVITENYGMMGRWIKWMVDHSNGYLRPEAGIGDWLSVDADTPKDVLATAFMAFCANLMSQMADAIGLHDDALKYSDLFEKVKSAFQAAFIDDQGRVKGGTQTCYLMALKMNLMPDDLRPNAAKHLVADIEARGWHLSTGFVGVGYLAPVLSEMGYDDIAFRLLETETYPSWLYPVTNGATTMWERWNSWTKDSGFGDVGMNSFNHYCFGSVGDWLYGYVGGIATDTQEPGFKRVVVKPRLGGSLTWAKASYKSIRGLIAVEWQVEKRRIHLAVSIPPNVTADVWVPLGDKRQVLESGVLADSAPGLSFKGFDGDWAVFMVGSGDYNFESL